MDDSASPAIRPGQLLALWTSPTEALARARAAIRPVLLSSALSVGFVTMAVIVGRWWAWVIAGLALASLVLTVLLWVNHRSTAKLRGDDLIDLVVMPDHLLVAGALRLDWAEISAVEVVTHDRINLHDHPRGDRLGLAIAAKAFHDGLNHLEVRFRLPDAKGVLARATTTVQKAQIIDEIGARAGFTLISLAERTDAEREQALRTIAEQADRHGVPVEVVQGDPRA
ncbi:hypothetical protein ACSDQ9_07980 [Aestuariimicrobium soli]|uniref:hypothetical protein n=1 Tax=Aestuariimicrobium soli TaxID=2035834 RepID=UPI003EBB5200